MVEDVDMDAVAARQERVVGKRHVDRVIAVDANPDRGTLSERIARPSGKTVRDLVRGRERVHGYNDVSTVVARDETRLDVPASDTDPMVSEAFSDDDYRHVAEIATHYYSCLFYTSPSPRHS